MKWKKVNMTSPRACRALLSRFPPRAFSMAYGSGVFEQAVDSASASSSSSSSSSAVSSSPKPMIDLVFAVDDPRAWHAANLERNPSDYAAHFRALGSQRGGAAAAWVQETGGAAVFYHPAVDAGNGVLIKYGVVATETLALDLDAWATLFVAGRLHKPTTVLEEWGPRGEEIDDVATDGPRTAAAAAAAPGFAALQHRNLTCAAAVASLLLPPRFDEHELFMAIANISYAGDARFLLGAEAPGKVRSIVDGSFAGFQTLYREPLAACGEWIKRIDDDGNGGGDAQSVSPFQQLERDASPEAVERAALAGAIPAAVRERIAPNRPLAAQAAELARLARDGDDALAAAVHGALASIVRAHSFGQQLKGVASAGPGRAISYGLAKLRKGGWSV